jgi:8-oxo-dGTP pyrophosphatase MutT (NUDIX family)
MSQFRLNGLLGDGGVTYNREDSTLTFTTSTYKMTVSPPVIQDEKQRAWNALTGKYGYEGAGVLLRNDKNELLFLMNHKYQAELPGGKLKKEDEGDAYVTALRTLKEETRLVLKREDLITCYGAPGGKTGCISYWFITPPLQDIGAIKIETPRFADILWSKIYRDEDGEWLVRNEADVHFVIRKCDRNFIEQVQKTLNELGTVEEIE